MRKYFLGLFSLAMAICFNVLQSNTPIPKVVSTTDETPMNWYSVIDDKIVSTTPLHTGKTKSEAIADDPCKDQLAPNCLFGTNASVSLNQDVSNEDSEQLIRRQN